MTLLGHDEAWHAFGAALASERMHHAWLLAGVEGMGKASFARAAAAALVAEPDVHQPAPGAHPDILILDPLPDGEEEARKREEGRPYRSKRSIGIDQVRRMQARLFTRPTLGRRRAVIVDAGDDLEKAAVNALLKSLEEPPAGTVFLLVTHRPGRLLPTVRSRCRMLRFAPLTDAAIDTLLRDHAPEADGGVRAAAVTLARGAPGAALGFVARDLGAAHATMRRLIARGDRDFALRGALVASAGVRPDRERLLGLLELARATLVGALPETPREQQRAIITAHEELARLSSQAPTYNFDPELLMVEIGGLLASAAVATDLRTSA